MSGFPDVVAFKDGVTILVECKPEGGKLRQSQEKFYKKIVEQLSLTLNYRLVRAGEFDDFVNIMADIYVFNEFEIPDNFREWRPKL